MTGKKKPKSSIFFISFCLPILRLSKPTLLPISPFLPLQNKFVSSCCKADIAFVAIEKKKLNLHTLLLSLRVLMHMYWRFQEISYTVPNWMIWKFHIFFLFLLVVMCRYGDSKDSPILAQLRNMSPAKNTNAPESKTKQKKIKNGSKTPLVTALHMHIQFLFKRHYDPFW